MFATFVFCVLILVIAFIYFHLKYVYNYWKKRNVAGPEPELFFGNIKDSVRRRRHIVDIYKEIYEQYPNEKVVGIFRMTAPTLIVRDLDIVKQILIKDFSKVSERGLLYSKKGLGDNLFHADTEAWKALRRHLTPMFSSGKLQNIVNILSRTGDMFLDHVANEIYTKQSEQELLSLLFTYNVATTMACSFGMETNFKDMRLYELFDKDIFGMSYINELDMLFPGILRKTNISLFGSVLNKFCYEVVEFIKKDRNNKPSTRNDVMDMLLGVNLKEKLDSKKENKSEINDHVMAGQVLTFLAAGYVNNTTTLTYSFWHLAMEQSIQEKLAKEIKTVLKAHNNELTLQAINEMSYLEMVFLETLRMHPTTNSIQRCAVEDYIIPGTDIKINKGTYVYIPPLAIHHDEKIYPEPEKFDPERFSTENCKSRHPYSFLSFGAGPRACIGIRMATYQYKVCVIKVLMKYRVIPSMRTKESYKIDPNRVSLGPEGGIYVDILTRS